MNKFISISFAAVALLALPQVGHAKDKGGNTTATSKNNTVSGAAAEAASVGAIFMPGAIGSAGVAGGAAAASASSGGWNQPQMIMNTAGAPSTGTFNDCGIAFSGGLWVLTFSYTGESKSCVAQRQAIFAASSLGRPDIAMERMCDDLDFRAANARTNGMQCAATIAERNKAQPVQPVAAAPQPMRVASTMPANCKEYSVGGKNFITCE